MELPARRASIERVIAFRPPNERGREPQQLNVNDEKDVPAPIEQVQSPAAPTQGTATISSVEPVSVPTALRVAPLVSKQANSPAAQSITWELWDFGGQDDFYPIHQFFLTRHGVYPLVFDMAKLLESEKETQQTLSYLKQWMDAIFLNTAGQGAKNGAPILLIGTRNDELKGERRRLDEVQDRLHRHLGGHPAWKSVVKYLPADGKNTRYFFPLDARNAKDVVLIELRKRLMELAEGIIAKIGPVPTSWLEVADWIRGSPDAVLPLNKLPCAEW